MILLKAPAKVNFYLEVVKKRTDGYHDIETVFQRIKLYDEVYLDIEKNGITVDCTGIPEKENLAYKTARLLQVENKSAIGVRIRLVKNIPVGSGLGGGSSDAASTLLGLNQLWGLGWAKDKLMSLGRKLGADVPFFISETECAWGSGRGDEIYPLVNKLKGWLVLVAFPFQVSTKNVYQELKIGLTKPSSGVKLLIDLLKRGNWEGLDKLLYNSLEEVTTRKYPEIIRVKEDLRNRGAAGTLMSGSGPSVFGIFQDEAHAKKIYEELKEKKWRVNLVETG